MFYYSIRELHEAYQARKTTPLEYVSKILARAKELAPGIFIHIAEQRALEEAKASTVRWQFGKPLGIFDGVPMVWKDLFHMKNVTTTAASLAYADAPLALEDSEAIKIFTAEGGINLGKVCLSEFAYSGLGINPEFTTHPNWYSKKGEERVPGGSSSGTALAICAQMCSVGMGTDTSGSIRVPAALHGLYGYKSADQWDCQEDVFPLSFTLDRIGPLAYSLQDCYDMYSLYHHRILKNLSELSIPNKVSIIVPTNIVLDDCSAAVLQQFHRALEILQANGLTVKYEHVDAIDALFDINEKHGTFAAAEAFYFHSSVLNSEKAELINPRVLKRMFRAKTMTAKDFVALEQLRKFWIQHTQAQFPNHIILMPTVMMEAPLLQPLEDDEELFQKTNLQVLRNTSIGNFLNWESASIPMGKGADNMPVGLMLSSPTIKNDDFFAITYSIVKTLQKKE